MDFKEYLETKGFSENTVNSYLKDVNLYINFCNKMGFEIYQRDSVYKFFSYLKARKLEDTSLKRKKASLSIFSNFLKIQGKEPIIDRKSIVIKPKKRLPGYMKTEEFFRLLNIFKTEEDLEYRNFFIVFFLFSTGVRVSELINIKKTDIDILNRRMVIKGKGNKERIIVFPDSLGLEYEEYYRRFRHIIDRIEYIFFNNRGKKITRRGVEFILENICKKNKDFINDKRIYPHLFRHSYATSLIENGGDIKTISLLMGHSSLDTTAKYTHLSVKRLQYIYQSCHPHA